MNAIFEIGVVCEWSQMYILKIDYISNREIQLIKYTAQNN